MLRVVWQVEHVARNRHPPPCALRLLAFVRYEARLP